MALDLWTLLEQLTIRTKGAKMMRLNRSDEFAWAQRELVAEIERQYNAGLPVRIIILKGRQLGMSTLTEAVLFIWSMLHPGSFSLVLSKEKEDSQYLFEMTKRYYELSPFKDLFGTKYYTKDEIVFDDTLDGSRIRVATASKDEVGRGMTIQAAHCSEVAFWGDQADTIVPGLENAIPYEHGTIWIHESTAFGVGGYFHEEWMAATDPEGGKSDFVPMFFPWYCHDEYEIPGHHLSYADLDDDEKDVMAFLLNDSVPADRVMAKMAWRRRKIQNHPQGLDGFHQEYPTTPDEAFLSTGKNVFPLEDLTTCYKPDVGWDRGFLYNDNGQLTFAEQADGHLWVYKKPDQSRRQKYAVAADPTRTLEGDPACIQVLNRATMEQVAVWHGHADPTTIGEIALAMAYWYNDALLNTEIQGGGKAVLDVWRNAGYGNIWADRRPDKLRKSGAVLGWSTTYDTKQWLIGTVQGVLRRHDVTIHHGTTYHEMVNYISIDDGTFGPARRSGHDDCVMSLGIAVMTCVTEWSSLDMNAVMGTDGRGEQGPGSRRLVFAGQGTTVDPMASSRFGSNDGVPLYALPSEIDDWG